MDTETMNVKKILLVEDDPQDVELALTALEDKANQVAVVDDGAEALDYLYRRGKFKMRAGSNPLLVLIDLKMPKVDGLETLKIIKADENLKIIPVVVFSSSRETPDLIECYRCGVNAYVVKPVDFTEFMEAIKQIGIFWAAINEPPPRTGEKTSGQRGKVISSGKKKDKNEIPAPYPALGG